MLNAVSEHLERVLHSQTFSSSPKISTLLRRLTVPLFDRASEAPKEQTLGIELFGRRPGWDPHLDSVVRTCVVRLRAKLDEYYESEGKSDPFRIEIPSGGYQATLRIVSIPESMDSQARDNDATTVPNSGRITRRVALSMAGMAGVLGSGLTGLLRPTTSEGSGRVLMKRLTYERGDVTSARFTPDGKSFVFSARWGGQESRLFQGRVGQRFSQPLARPPAELQDLSRQGELLFTLGDGQIGTLARAELSGGPIKEIAESVADAKWLPNGKDMVVARVERNEMTIDYPIGNPIFRHQGILGATGLGISPGGRKIAWVDASTGHLDIYCAEQGSTPHCLSKGWMLVSGNLQWQDEQMILMSGSRKGVPAIQRLETRHLREECIYTCPLVWSLYDQSATGTILAAATDSRLFVSLKAVGSHKEETFRALASAAVAGISVDGTSILLAEILGSGSQGNLPILLLKSPGGLPITLGEGFRPRFSPKSTEVAWVEAGADADAIVVSPVSTGPPRRYPVKGVRCHSVEWISDSTERFLLNVSESSGSTVSRIFDPRSGIIRPIPNATSLACTSTAGWAVSSTRDMLRLIQIETGKTREVCTMSRDWRPIRWSENPAMLFVYEASLDYSSGRIACINIETGEKTTVLNLHPADDTGVYMRSAADITPDGRFCAYTYQRDLADLYTIDGLIQPAKS